MIDFHSHVLPGIDDGAKNLEMSLEMLKESYRQGINTVVCTPHCYLKNVSEIDSFVKKRDKSFNLLKDAVGDKEFPRLVLGCELKALTEVYEGFDEIRRLCIAGTDYILIEMPYDKWNIDHYDFVYRLILNGMRPIIAHIERFWKFRKEFYNLYSLDVLYQINADSLLYKPDKYHIMQLFSEGAVQLLGSDMHNSDTRKTNMDKAEKAIIKAYGEERAEYLNNNARAVLDNRIVEVKSFEKPGFFQKMKL